MMEYFSSWIQSSHVDYHLLFGYLLLLCVVLGCVGARRETRGEKRAKRETSVDRDDGGENDEDEVIFLSFSAR